MVPETTKHIPLAEALTEKGKPTRSVVFNSWRRSFAYGINPNAESTYVAVAPEQLKDTLKKNEELIRVSLLEMERMLERLEGPHPCAVLFDSQGVLIARVNVVGNENFPEEEGFDIGCNWSEEAIGTNAVGVTLAEKEACYLGSDEHFIRTEKEWTGFASPIFDSEGELQGALCLVYLNFDISSAHEITQVINAARSIEQSLYQKRPQPLSGLDYQAHNLAGIIFSGVILIDERKKITFMNHWAEDYFGVSSAEFTGRDLSSLLPPHNDLFWSFINKNVKTQDREFSLKLPDGFKNRGRKIVANFLPLPDFYNVPCPASPLQQPDFEGMVISFQSLDDQLKPAGKGGSCSAKAVFSQLIGESPAFLQAVEQAKLFSETDANVLLLGESGVGKDLFAQCIHNASRRMNGPYFALNCAAIPGELLSSELFGYDEGAFTGAKRGGNPGKLELASHGSLLLDEIGEMPVSFQAYLLRAIESGEISRLGSSRVTPVQTRILSATNRDINQAIQAGEFRADLYYRLAVTSVEIPPLRKRREDIPLIAEYYMKKIAGELDRPVRKMSPGFLDSLTAFSFPGNIRELRNVIERAVILSKGGTLDEALVPPYIREAEETDSPKPLPTCRDSEREMIEAYLNRFRYNKTKAAAALGISRSNLYKKLREYGL